MASPFSVFRKNQKVWMAVLAVLAMFAFVIADYLQPTGMGNGGSRPDNAVVETEYGTLTEADVESLVFERTVVREFLTMAMRSQPIDPQFGFFIFQQMQAIVNRIGPDTETAAVESYVMAEQAQEAGLQVSDETITEFLDDITNQRVTAQQFSSILGQFRTRQGQKLNKSMLYDMLRRQMLAWHYRDFFFQTIQYTPAERFEYFSRTRRRATAELVSVRVSDFVDQVAEPTDAQLQAFFDKYKNELPVPGSAEPGFRIPQLARFQYFKADYASFSDPQAVTQQEIEEFYEKNKAERYRYDPASDTTLHEEPAEQEPPQETTEGAGGTTTPEPAGTTPGEEGTSTTPSETSAPGETSTPSETPAPSETSQPMPQTPAETPAEPAGGDAPADAPAPENPPASEPGENSQSPAEESNAEPAGDESSATSARDDTELAARMLREQIESGDELLAQAETPAETPESDTADTETSKASAPGGDTLAGGQTTETPAAPEPPPELGSNLVLPTDITEGPSPEFEPLWKVQDEIRKELASQRAVAAIEEIFTTLREAMRSHALSDQRGEVMDFEPLAAQHEGISAHTTEMLSAYEAGQMAGLGQANVRGQDFVPFAYQGLRLYQTADAEDSDGNRYLWWKIEEKEERVPELADVREEVVRAYKTIQAREPALKRANELAEQARKEGKSLETAFAGQENIEVAKTGSFSWLSGGSADMFQQSANFSISEVPQVEDAGPDFMREVFQLGVGDVGVAVNNPQTVAYVVRVTSLEPDMALLREMFLEDSFGQYASAAASDQIRYYEDWKQQQLEQAGVKWLREPRDQVAMR